MILERIKSKINGIYTGNNNNKPPQTIQYTRSIHIKRLERMTEELPPLEDDLIITITVPVPEGFPNGG